MTKKLVLMGLVQAKQDSVEAFNEWYLGNHVEDTYNCPAVTSVRCFKAARGFLGDVPSQFLTIYEFEGEDAQAAEVFEAFQAYQRAQPVFAPLDLLRLPKWLPRRRAGRGHAEAIRRPIARFVDARLAEIAAGTAPDDLATRLLSATDPETGTGFDRDEMIDQVAIFFLAGHETSASALAWALYLLAEDQDAQVRVAAEAKVFWENPSFSALSGLKFTRNVFREALRLYPPVPMMVREASHDETFRGRTLRKGAQLVLSPWHTHRNPRIWGAPDVFDPDRWDRAETRESQREGYLPFSSGPRVCPGAGFAMAEGVILLSALVRACQVHPVPDRRPVPVAHLTVRARDGIWNFSVCMA